MLKMIKGLMLVSLAIFAVGCASGNPSSGGVTARAYLTDKDREDQDRSVGNKGYLSGTPKEDADSAKSTRKVYVVEFTKELPEDSSNEPLIPPRPPKPQIQPRAVQPQPVEEPVPYVQPVERIAPQQESCEEYTVQNGDTLQKIAKKFYGSYKKWNRIYEANREKLEDPDAIKVGMVLCVPGAGAAVQPEVENLK